MSGVQSVSNYLVPATGSTNCFAVRRNFTATPFLQTFNGVELSGIPFRPSGVIMDNYNGTADLVVKVNEMSLNIVCPAGQMVQMQFPAPLNCTFNITGGGDATVVFVDYPVIPYSTATGGGSSIPVPLPVNGPLTDAELRAAPLNVQIAPPTPSVRQVEYRRLTADATITDATSVSIYAQIGVLVNGVLLDTGMTIDFVAPPGDVLEPINIGGNTLSPTLVTAVY